MIFKTTQNIVFKYFISLFVFDTLVFFILEFIFNNLFASIPYYRLAIILFTFIFFTPTFLLKKQNLVRRKIKNQDYIVIIWCLISIIEFIHGFLIGNPRIYLFADFIYIIFGVYIYFMLSNNILENNENIYNLENFGKLLILFFILFYFVNGFFSENFYFISLSLTYVFLIKRKYLLALFLLIPFLIQIKYSNRALLICFISTIIFYFIFKMSLFLNKRGRILMLTFISFFLVFFHQEFLIVLIKLVPENSDLYFRIQQLLDVIEKGIDFGDPRHVSIAQRLVEAKVVISIWVKNIFTFIFGSGLGAVIDGNLFIDSSVTKTALLGAKSIHNIHLLPFALIHKYGLLGLILFFILVIEFLNSIKNILKKNQNIIFVFWNLTYVLIFVYSLPAASFLWTSSLFWITLSMKRNSLYVKNKI